MVYDGLVGRGVVQFGSVVSKKLISLLIWNSVFTASTFAEICAKSTSSQAVTVKFEASSLLAVAWLKGDV